MMAFNEKAHDKLGLIFSTVGATIGNWAIGQKSISGNDNDAPVDFDSLKLCICQSIDMLRMYPGFRTMPKIATSSTPAASAPAPAFVTSTVAVQSEASILFPSHFNNIVDSRSSFGTVSMVSSSIDDENSNSSPVVTLNSGKMEFFYLFI